MEQKKNDLLAKLDEYIYCMKNSSAVCKEYIEQVDALSEVEKDAVYNSPEYKIKAKELSQICESIREQYKNM